MSPARTPYLLIAILLAAVALLVYRQVAQDGEPSVAVRADEARRQTFERIYDRGSWAKGVDGTGTSGPGSTLQSTKLYRVFLQDFLRAQGIRSVVDAGCGDWEFAQALDWTGIDYLGLDIVASVIAGNQRQFGKANVRFAVADITRDELPPADLLIIKDVLQHLSNADIRRVLAQLPRYRHVLIVNDVEADSLTAEPADTATGGYRPIDVTRPPHSLPGAKVLAWGQQGGHTKLVVYLKRRESAAAGGADRK
jgi:SAM-dependent methyltransferase